jgi:hypothetical protein
MSGKAILGNLIHSSYLSRHFKLDYLIEKQKVEDSSMEMFLAASEMVERVYCCYCWVLSVTLFALLKLSTVHRLAITALGRIS